MRLAADGHRHIALEQLLNLRGPRVGPQPCAQIDVRGLPQRNNRACQHHAVRDHGGVLALGEGRVEQPQGCHGALHLPGNPAALEAHALAHPEGPGAEQHHARDEVAKCLLGRETEHHRRHSTTDGERPRLEAGEPECHEHRESERDEPDEETDGAGVGRVHPAEEGGTDRAAEVTGERPARAPPAR